MPADTLDAPSAYDLAPDQIAAMRAEWVSHGYDPVQFDKAASGVTEDSQGASEPVEAPDTINLNMPALTAAQSQEMAFALREAGVPQDQIDAALAADGLAPLAPDMRTEDEIEFDRAFPTPKPEDYNVNYFGRFPPNTDLSLIAAADRDLRAWAVDLRLPPEVGSAVIERALDATRAIERMSEPARQLWVREQMSDFTRICGGAEKAAERLKLAGKTLAKGGIAMTEALHKAGALNDAGIVLHLAHQAERVATRSHPVAALS